MSQSVLERPAAWARHQAHAYRDGQDRPLGGYVATMGLYGAGVGTLGALAWRAGRRVPDGVRPWDLALLTAATHRAARTLAKDPVTSPLRAPLARYEGLGGESELAESVRGEGLRHSLGELVTCPFCLAQWVATAFAGGLVLAPRQTRLVMAVFTAVGGADFLQHLYAIAQKASTA